MNYLDILNDDLTNKILDIVADLYEKDIEKANNKLLKVNKLVEGLNIDIYSAIKKFHYINYSNISYCMDKYLYSKYPLENVIIIYMLKLIVYYNVQENTHTPIILRSEKLQSPLYLDILREINKIYEKQTEIFGYYDNCRFLENIIPVKESEYEYYEINPLRDSQDSQDSQDTKINYITFECFP
jgi:hypothetical protein